MKRAPLWIAIGGAVLRLALACRSLPALDRLFVPDDAYYTLAIARSLAAGLGPSTDGVHLTNGFQPLLAFLLVPLPKLGTALAMGAVADGITAWCLAKLAEHVVGADSARESADRANQAAALAATIWAFSPSAIATALNGLETSLTLACLTGGLLAYSAKKPWTGVILGLCLLARVDSVFLVAAVGAALVHRDGLRKTAPHVAQAAVVVAPWWIYELRHFGTIVPESGAAVREQAMMYRDAGMVVRDQIAWATGAVVGPPFVDVAPLRQFLGGTASGVGMVLGLTLAGGAAWLLGKRLVPQGEPSIPLAILVINALCIFVFYALYLPATWFFRRYLVPVHLCIALLVAVHVRRREAFAWLAVAALSIAPFFYADPKTTPDQGHHGAKGYWVPAGQILDAAPPGAVIGSFQSGALGWRAAEPTSGASIVNLDGVVDGEARRAVRDHTLAAFARSRGVTHLADWDVNAKLFRDRAGPNPPALVRIAEAEPQGTDERFVLYRLDWPAP